MENKKLSPFRFAQQIRKGEKLIDLEEIREFQPYLITKLYYYSGREKLANFINMLWRLPKEIQYRLFCVFFRGYYPRGWIKSDKKKDGRELEIDYLKKKYQVSTKVAQQYVELLTDADRKEIKKTYG